MAATAGIYLTHPSLDFGDELEREVANALRPLLAFERRAEDPPGRFNARVERASGASFVTLAAGGERDPDPEIARAKAVLIIDGQPTEARVALAKALGKLLARAGFGVAIDDDSAGRVELAA